MKSEAALKRLKSSAIVQRNYIGRVSVYFLSSFVLLPELYTHNKSLGIWIYSTAVLFLFPHLAYIFAKKAATPQKVELKNMLVEGFLVGAFFPIINFSLLPVLTVFLPSLIYTSFYRGIRFYSKVLQSTILGSIVSSLLFGFKVHLGSGTFATSAAAIILPIIILGLVINIRSDYEFSRKNIRLGKERLEELAQKLSKYLSPQVYSQIFLGKKDVRIESYRKKLSIFFSDIKGFTSLTDSLETEELNGLLNNYFNEMASIALKHGGTVDKYIGDSIMIFFGDPESRGEKEDAQACVFMALEMRAKLEELRAKWSEMGMSKELRIRMGINTGYCTVGNFGSDDRLDYTIIGGQVNLASRLESAAPVDQILISHETYALVKDKVACKRKGEIMVKGIAYPVQTYQVLDLLENMHGKEEQFCQHCEGFSLAINFEKVAEEDAINSLKKAIQEIETRAEETKEFAE